MSKKLLMLTTCIVNEENIQDLLRMVRSYRDGFSNCIHLILLQGDLSNFKSAINALELSTHIISVPNVISLSKARNIMFEHAMNSGFLDLCEVIAFPDDDCWYPDNNLSDIFTLFEKNTTLDLFVCRYSASTQSLHQSKGQNLSLKQLVSYGSSATLFTRVSCLDKKNFFDESLGIGSPNNGGEDLDFALRVFKKSRHGIFFDHPLVGHSDKVVSKNYRYFQGSFRALRKNLFLHPLIPLLFIRKFLVGIYYVLRFGMPVKKFFSSPQKLKGLSNGK